MIQNIPNSNVQKQNEATFLISNPLAVFGTSTQTEKIIGYVVTTNDIVTSNLNVATTFGRVIVVITTKVRVAERNLNPVTRRC
jgi:hypothetical protein